MANPCSCVGTYTPPPEPCCPANSCECLDLGYITVFPDDSVTPCDTNGTVSFTDCFEFCACENEVATLVVVENSNPEKLVVNTITQSGLAFTITEEAEPNDKITLVIKGTCISDNTGELLGDYSIISIYVKDLCKTVTCDVGESCNKCTGECEPDINLNVS